LSRIVSDANVNSTVTAHNGSSPTIEHEVDEERPRRPALAWGVHAFTASGAVVGTVSSEMAGPIAGAAALLFAAAVTASMLPAARASRIDVLQSLRSE
jgi:hypothetical protein